MDLMKFEWDEDKNESNFSKHGVWFEEAQTLWADVYALEFFDPEHSDFEDRFIRIGHSSKERLLSARKATKREAREYEEGI